MINIERENIIHNKFKTYLKNLNTMPKKIIINSNQSRSKEKL